MSIPLAKPTGITIPDHTTHVVVELYKYLLNQPFAISKLQSLFPEIDVKEELIKSGMLHDEGKKAPPWQIPCVADFELFKKKLPLFNIMRATVLCVVFYLKFN